MTLTPLLESLERLDEAHVHMLDLADSKKQSIKENKVEDLIRILNKESKQLKLIEQLEEERGQAAYAFLQGVGIRSNLNLNLTELSRLVFDLEDKQKLLDIQKRLSGTLQKLKEANTLNQQLLQQALSYIDFSIESMSYYSETEATYHHPAGKSAGVQRPGLFDSRA
ncbi:flagellar protein FlgN [Paenibacillus sp. S150]|uniref:flagellar protein FlgN n=1 Tax=Paenibacillus sp. S150 TaxID=2749826 RepID=UPI001C55992E|nr:flagellar protein FlgN [Paenibacillus sp. S150]MBW4081672.1 flagellar protein FlgN [Paenibacillus sp. S150]